MFEVFSVLISLLSFIIPFFTGEYDMKIFFICYIPILFYWIGCALYFKRKFDKLKKENENLKEKVIKLENEVYLLEGKKKHEASVHKEVDSIRNIKSLF